MQKCIQITERRVSGLFPRRRQIRSIESLGSVTRCEGLKSVIKSGGNGVARESRNNVVLSLSARRVRIGEAETMRAGGLKLKAAGEANTCKSGPTTRLEAKGVKVDEKFVASSLVRRRRRRVRRGRGRAGEIRFHFPR